MTTVLVVFRRPLVALACVSGSGCGWMFPDDRDVPESVREMLADPDDLPCPTDEDRLRLAAVESARTTR